MAFRTHSLAAFFATAAGTLIALPFAPLAFAQDTADEGLEEVTVTATRRTETNLQETPISVTAVTAEDLDRSVAKDISGLAASVPGFSASRITAFNAASFALRGVGLTDIIVYQDSPVGVQVDDFVMPSVQTQLLDTFDLESAEVLRGPQGTLFGKNTTGGAVNIRTKRPSMDTVDAQIRLGLAKFGERQVQAAFDVPLVEDKFALRFVASSIKSDGYYRLGATFGPIVSFNTNPAFGAVGSPFTIPGITGQAGRGTGERTGGQDSLAGRIKAQWNVTDNFTALLQYEVLRDRSDAVPSFNDTPASPLYLWNALGFTSPMGDPLDNVASTQRNDSLLRMGSGQRIDVDGAYLNLDWELSDAYKLYSVTGYRKQTEHLPNTYTGAAPVANDPMAPNFGQSLSLFDATRDTSRDTFQQEIRIASDLGGPFNYVAGAFYQRNDARFCVIQLLGFVDLIQNFGAAMLPQQLLNNSPQVLCNKQKSDSLAGFIDGTWDVSERFQLGAGFRYTRDEKAWEGRAQGGVETLGAAPGFALASIFDPIDLADWTRFPGSGFNAATCTASFANSDSRFNCANGSVLDFSNLETTWSEPSWRLTGRYKFSDDAYTYLTVSRGYKAGGYNDQTATSGILVPELTRPVDPEFATNYEIGFKTEWLDNRLRINPAIFFTKYDDAQRAANVVTVKGGAQFQETVFYNAAEVSSKGLELEIQAAVTDNFQMRLSGAYLDAEYDQFQLVQPGITAADGSQIIAINQDLSGLPVPRSPKKSASIMGIYTWPLASGGKVQFIGDVYYEDENLFYISAAGRAFDAYLDSKTLLNSSITWTSADANWTAKIYGRNLSDERYRIASQSVATLWTHSQFGEPRNVGIQVGFNFKGDGPAPRAPKDSDGDGVTDDIDRCPGTPAGTRVDASGCPLPADSDGDGVTDDKDRCPNTPAGTRVDANGCELDSDGDGVGDSKDQCPNTPAGVTVGPTGCELDSDNDGVVDSLDKCPDTPVGDRVDATGCSFKEEIKLPGVVFESNSAELKSESYPILDGAVSTLKRYPDLVVEVAGHTDSVGNDRYNLSLSERRAQTVLKYLTDNGATNKLSARGYGERQPVASNADEGGRRQNRRVVLRIVE
jgi:iron complex outermembrane receptor protein